MRAYSSPERKRARRLTASGLSKTRISGACGFESAFYPNSHPKVHARRARHLSQGRFPRRDRTQPKPGGTVRALVTQPDGRYGGTRDLMAAEVSGASWLRPASISPSLALAGLPRGERDAAVANAGSERPCVGRRCAIGAGQRL